ncbi:MAG: iron-containing alcohol dehydrogenase [Planctomycetota bacterium]|jgi:alcohol dehydrogenase class IV
MRFEFATATRIVFGDSTFGELGKLAARMLAGQKDPAVLVVSGSTTQHTQALLKLLAEQDLNCSVLNVEGEPTVELVRQGTQLAREKDCRLVIGIGGGSAIDTGKAVAAMIDNTGDLLDYLEVIGKGEQLTQPPVPYIAVPTTAGTGAEVTRNAVIASATHKVKVSLRSPLMLPRLALIDPELTYHLPPDITASTGMDALTQLIEAYVSVKATPLTDAICGEGIQRAARSLVRAYQDGRDSSAREDMAIASLFSGLALANAGLGAAHGFAAPLGGMFNAPHGAVCAALIPQVMAVNVKALRQRSPESEALSRYDRIGQILNDDSSANAEDAVQWIQQVCQQLSIPGLQAYGLTQNDLPTLIEKGRAASSMKGNPITLTPNELHEILTQSL